jgi:hypothetical protein
MRLRRSLTILSIMAAAGATAPAMATAEPPAREAATIVSRTVDPAAAASVPADFWTPERMRRAEANTAKDGGEPLRLGTAPQPRPAAETPERELAKPVAPSVTAPGQKVTMSNAVGKVYYVNAAGEEKVCSAATVNSNGLNMLFTAGHCLHGGPGSDWHRLETWEFHAGRTAAGTPAGHTFRLHTAATWAGWTDYGDHNYDDGVVILERNELGYQVVHMVGGNGLSVGGPYDLFHTILGYLDVEDFQRYLQGLTGFSSLYPGMMSFQGAIGPGASGGPWLLEYSDDPSGYGLGYVHGVSSTANTFNWSWSPYFTEDLEGMLYFQYRNYLT